MTFDYEAHIRRSEVVHSIIEAVDCHTMVQVPSGRANTNRESPTTTKRGRAVDGHLGHRSTRDRLDHVMDVWVNQRLDTCRMYHPYGITIMNSEVFVWTVYLDHEPEELRAIVEQRDGAYAFSSVQKMERSEKAYRFASYSLCRSNALLTSRDDQG